jgi:hypothetical protein
MRERRGAGAWAGDLVPGPCSGVGGKAEHWPGQCSGVGGWVGGWVGWGDFDAYHHRDRIMTERATSSPSVRSRGGARERRESEL